MDPSVVAFSRIGRSDLPLAGGKGANLGELSGAGIKVPPGFVVTTVAFDAFVAGCVGHSARLDALDALGTDDVEGARKLAGEVREALLKTPVPTAVADALTAALDDAGVDHAYAVRSSATLEDLPDASFAGQQDTFLNAQGPERILDDVRRCWASLFTDRAVLYRRQNGWTSAEAKLAVVVQRMVRPDASGILFTADPVTGHRERCAIDASWGLGEAIVAGLVNADSYRADKQSGRVTSVHVGDKSISIQPLPDGGTHEVETAPEDRERRVLGEEQVAALVSLGRRIEDHMGAPQDVEWCLQGDELFVVQSRPVTSLFPVPPRPPDQPDGLRVYVSFGHIQVNTDVWAPASHDMLRQIIPFGKESDAGASAATVSAGGRLFLDATGALLRRPARIAIPRILRGLEARIADAINVVLEREELYAADGRRPARMGLFFRRFGLPAARRAMRNFLRRDLSRARDEFDIHMTTAIDAWRQRFADAADLRARLELTPLVFGSVFTVLIPVFPPAVMAGGIAWRLVSLLTSKFTSDSELLALTRGFEGNATTEMDLALGDIADLARELPSLRAAIDQAVEHDDPPRALHAARALEDTGPFFAAWDEFLAEYGHRAIGELDLLRPRWREDPSTLIASLSGMLHAPDAGSHRAQHRRATDEAEQTAAEILRRCGPLKRPIVRRLIRVMRAYLALREHGKFHALHLVDLGRDALLEAGAALRDAGRLARQDDVFWLWRAELLRALDDDDDMRDTVAARKAEWARYARLRTPRVLLSTGETPAPPPPRQLGPGMLGGLRASHGVVEGVARVILDPAQEVLRHGEILVAPHTDPGWTPLFVHAAGLVLEVGGLMTHGSVVAREYGIPAVVGVDDATRRIRSGQRIRVDGDRGVVELLATPP
jgi:pyruvate,water dikinase